MNHWPHHHSSCFCWVCRGNKPGHPSDRCHCGRCLAEWLRLCGPGELPPPQSIGVAKWDGVQPHIAALQAAGYYVSPVGECEGDVYIEVESEAVEMWNELVNTGVTP